MTEIRASVAGRKITGRKRSSVIGELIDPFRKRSIQHESLLERLWLSVFIEDPRILEIREQQKVFYYGRDGKKRHRWIDIVLIYRDGTKRFVECKYRDQATTAFRNKLDEDARYFLRSGDRAEVLTELELSGHPLWRIACDIETAKECPHTVWEPKER